ncbi:hypothetical protein [uncultured Nonlabens sp.]|uniref:hypothetical protein n=1 Tax=uncultured Nonlabens sp. TaxID=859306 RepID=UPI00262E1CB6|nr:hypothetical protein [uncultured Nonlabens sp.]
MRFFIKSIFNLSYIFVLLVFMANDVRAQNFNDANSYLTFIDSQNEKVVTSVWNYMQVYTFSKDDIAIKGRRKQLENTIRKSMVKVNKIKAFDPDLKRAMINYLEGNLAIVKEDLLVLLKSKDAGKVVTNQLQIIQNIRKAVYKLRADYNDAIAVYGDKHDLIIKENTSELAHNMKQTIMVYDYYNELQLAFSNLQQVERNFWQGLNEKDIASYRNAVVNLKSKLYDTLQLEKFNSYSLDDNLYNALVKYNEKLHTQVTVDLKPIELIKEDAQTGSRENIMAKTEAYNAAIHDANVWRKHFYKEWREISTTFLQSHVPYDVE